MKKLGKDILITGGAGYVGQNLINYFLQKNYTISVIDNLST
jgi:UDP-N-acetylglucosamine 4-epimerase